MSHSHTLPHSLSHQQSFRQQMQEEEQVTFNFFNDNIIIVIFVNILLIRKPQIRSKLVLCLYPPFTDGYLFEHLLTFANFICAPFPHTNSLLNPLQSFSIMLMLVLRPLCSRGSMGLLGGRPPRSSRRPITSSQGHRRCHCRCPPPPSPPHPITSSQGRCRCRRI